MIATIPKSSLLVLLVMGWAAVHAADNVWEPLGLNAGGGACFSGSFSPANPAIGWITTSVGIRKSIDSGASWFGVPDTLGAPMYVVRPHPSDADCVVAANGSTHRMILTRDGGATWTVPALPADNRSSRSQTSTWPIWDAIAADVLWLPIYNGSWQVWRSGDRGRTWAQVGDGGSRRLVGAIRNGGATRLLAFDSGANRQHHSDDGGATWTATNYTSTGSKRLNVDWLTIDPEDSAIRLTMHRDTTGVVTLMRSADSGATWTALSGSVGEYPVQACANGVMFRMGPTTVSSGSVLRSLDRGATWTTLRSGVNSITSSPAQPATLVVGTVVAQTTSCALRSTNATAGSATWSQVSGLAFDDIRAMAFSSSEPNRGFFAEFTTSQVWRTADGGVSFAPTTYNTGLIPTALATDPRPGTRTVIVGCSGGIRRSTDDGATWSGDLGGPSVLALDMSPNRPDIILACGAPRSGGVAVYKSTDNGQTWSPASSGLPSGATFQSIAIARSSANHYYAIGSSAGVWRSADAGATWTRVRNTGGQRIVAAADDHNIVVTETGRSTDAGATWTAFASSLGLPNGPFALDDADPAVIHYNRLKSGDRGATWRYIGYGAKAGNMGAMLPLPQSRMLWCGTSNGVDYAPGSTMRMIQATPSIASVLPAEGPAAGGGEVVIAGAGFMPGDEQHPSQTVVTFGGTAATSVVVHSTTRITCRAPAGTAGATAAVTVSNPTWLTATRAGAYTWRSSTGNTAPTLGAITANPSPAQIGQAVAFSVSGNDGDGDTLTYAWDFGDGGSASGGSPSHTYASGGSMTVTVTVSDGRGGSAIASRTLSVAGGGASLVSVVAIDGTALEASASDVARVRFSRSGSTASPLTIAYVLSGTAGTADYQALPGSVTIPAGAPFAEVTLTATQDSQSEGDETVVFTITAGNYTPSQPVSAVVTILDDEDLPTGAPQITGLSASPPVLVLP